MGGYWDNPSFALHYGYNAPGMYGMHIAKSTYNNPGAFSEVQLITATSLEFCGVTGYTIHQSGSGLDGTVGLTTCPDGYYDDPGIGLDNGNTHQTFSGSYITYLMYQHDPGSITVPLKYIAWNWSGVADASGGWHLTTSDKHITDNNEDTTVFPAWTNIINGMAGYTFSKDTTFQ